MAEKRNASEDFNVVGQMAQWLGVAEDEMENFVKEAMTRRGHKPVTGWKEAEESGSGGDKTPSNVFGLNIGGTQKKASGSGWQYTGS